MNLNIDEIRSEFPALNQSINGSPLVYFDSAATSLKPRHVINRLSQFYSFEASNVHRGAHFLSDRATDLYEQARLKVANFIHAEKSQEIIFVRGTTEGLNLIAWTLGKTLEEGDEVIISDIEHHANIVPWQMLCEEKKLTLKVIRANKDGSIPPEALRTLISPKSKILSVTHASNHLGNIIDLKPLISEAHANGMKVVVDGAQAIGKIPVDVQDLDVDFYVFSGHKMFAPFGIGVVYGKDKLLQQLPPYQGGGSMISKVSFAGTTYNDSPLRFEAGTPNVGGAIGLMAAIEFIEQIGLSLIEEYENVLTQYALDSLPKIQGIQLLGPMMLPRIPVFAFNIGSIHGSDIGHILNQMGIAVRTGHHCTQPLLEKLHLAGSVRASFSIYNTESEIEKLIAGLNKAKDLLQ